MAHPGRVMMHKYVKAATLAGWAFLTGINFARHAPLGLIAINVVVVLLFIWIAASARDDR